MPVKALNAKRCYTRALDCTDIITTIVEEIDFCGDLNIPRVAFVTVLAMKLKFQLDIRFCASLNRFDKLTPFLYQR